jgi:molybdopterin converting factor small subunit
VRIARNEAFAGDDEPVQDGDVVALIPPVAGG